MPDFCNQLLHLSDVILTLTLSLAHAHNPHSTYKQTHTQTHLCMHIHTLTHMQTHAHAEDTETFAGEPFELPIDPQSGCFAFENYLKKKILNSQCYLYYGGIKTKTPFFSVISSKKKNLKGVCKIADHWWQHNITICSIFCIVGLWQNDLVFTNN